ncbi:MAG: GNAT family N-acetyltransferase [Pyrinomonadaceae bacterium]
MTIKYRPAEEADLPETVDLFLTAVADMYARNGVSSPLPERQAVETGYAHILRSGIFHVAEVDGRVGAICNAVVRDDLWFLSGFWSLPHLQRQGIGGALLDRVISEGRDAGASTFFTWSSIDLTAMAVYMKKGMLPGYQILTFAGTPLNLPPDERDGYQVEPLSMAEAMRFDELVRASRREIDHKFWLSEAGHEGRQVIREGRPVGYFYFNHGTIGPAAWLDSADAEALMRAACREAAAQAAPVRMMIPGANHAAIRFALRAGLRLAAYSHLLTTSPFGRMEQYLSSGPLLF